MFQVGFPKIKTALEFAVENKFSSFYKDKYGKEKFNIKKVNSYADFQKIPFLTKKEIAKVPPFKRLFMPEKEVSCWLRTSGTTSKKPLLIPASRYVHENIDILAEMMAHNKVKRFLFLRPLGGLVLDLSDFPFHPKLSAYPLILGDISNLDLTSKIIANLEVDAIDVTPSALYFLIPYLKDVYDLRKIRFLRILGEFVSEQKSNFFRSYFKNAYFHYDIGIAETRGGIGVRCSFLDNNYAPRFYHTKSDLLHEVINEKGDIVENGNEGELVLTTLFKTPFPLIRYRTSDSVKISEIKCICGREGLMEHNGRIGYDSIRVGGVTVYTHLVDEALSKSFNGQFVGVYELHVSEEVYKNRLVPRLILKIASQKFADSKVIAKKIESNLKVGSNIYLNSLVSKEIFAPLVVEKVDKFEETYKKLNIISHLK